MAIVFRKPLRKRFPKGLLGGLTGEAKEAARVMGVGVSPGSACFYPLVRGAVWLCVV